MNAEMLAWFMVACLTCLSAGLMFPRLCPRCKLETQWVKGLAKEFQKEVKKVQHDERTAIQRIAKYRTGDAADGGGPRSTEPVSTDDDGSGKKHS